MYNFEVTVNPFKREAVLKCLINECEYIKTIFWGDIDEWNSFEMENKTFDIHFYYDAEFLVSIYPVEDNKVDFSKSLKVDLIIKLTD